MNDRIKNLPPFLSSTIKLVTGAGLGQIISLAISPFLTRIYSPTEFGVYTFFISIVGAFGLVATLRYEMAVILQKSDDEAINMSSLSLFIALLISGLLLVGIAFLVFFFPDVIGDEIPLPMLFSLPLLVFMIGAGNVLQHWFNRNSKYTILAVGKVLNSAGNNGGMLVLGLLGFGIWGLTGGFLIGSVMFVLFFLLVFLYSDANTLQKIHVASFAKLRRRHRDLPLSNTPQVVVEMLQNYGIIYLVQIFFSTAIIGWYSLSMRILQAPLMLIGTSISQVLYKDAAQQYQDSGRIREIVWKTVRLNFLIALPIVSLLLIAGPWLFGIVFGEAWKESGVYARILAPWMFFDFIRYSIAQIPLIVNRTRTMFYISIAGTIIMLLSMCAGGLYFHDVMTGFILLSATMSLYAIGVILWILSITKLTS